MCLVGLLCYLDERTFSVLGLSPCHSEVLLVCTMDIGEPFVGRLLEMALPSRCPDFQSDLF